MIEVHPRLRHAMAVHRSAVKHDPPPKPEPEVREPSKRERLIALSRGYFAKKEEESRRAKKAPVKLIAEAVARWKARGGKLKPVPREYPAVFEIVRACCAFYGVSKAEFDSHRRPQHMVRCRQVAYWLAKKLCSRSFPEIGRVMGDRDHTTIMHGCDKVELVLTGDETECARWNAAALRDQLTELERIILEKFRADQQTEETDSGDTNGAVSCPAVVD